MPDTMTPTQRHNCMSHIKGKNTKPEMLVRRYLFSAGFRYRIHVKKLPGCPDIVLPKYHTCIFVNGCFWHGHEGCQYYTHPKVNPEFWEEKVKTNKARDQFIEARLEAMGWNVLIIWECELKKQIVDQTLEKVTSTLLRNREEWIESVEKRRLERRLTREENSAKNAKRMALVDGLDVPRRVKIMAEKEENNLD